MTGAFRCGRWVVLPAEDRLRGPLGEAHLRPKAMDVLAALAECDGEVVGHDELLHAVWGEAAVTDAVLTNALSQIRRALLCTGDRRR